MGKIFCNLQYHGMLHRTDKDCTVLLQRYGFLCQCGAISFLMQLQT